MSDVPELPSFEATDVDDRPPPPSISDYPIGCEVGLVDINIAKVAQTEELWEPFMDHFFTQGRRTVRVVRHQGDYTFVVSEEDSMIVGCTLYRACLCEPKVRIGKYGGTNAIVLGCDSTHSIERRTSGLSLVTDREGDAVWGPDSPFPDGAAADGAPVLEFTPPRESEIPSDCLERGGPCVQEQPTKGQATLEERRYNSALMKAYDARMRKDYSEAVRYCTKALRHCPSGCVRALANRSAMYLSMRDPKAALADALKVIELMPSNYVGYVRAGNAMRGLKRNGEARNFYQEALKLDPNNETIKYLEKDNAVLMVYASRRRRGQHAYVSVDRSTLNIILVSGKDQCAGDVAWEEITSIVAPLGETADLCDASACICPPHVCGNCYRPLTKVEDFFNSLVGVELSLLNELYSGCNAVSCTYSCGTVFCSENCRTKGWASHHWIECPVIGKWREAFKNISAVYRSFYADCASHINMVTPAKEQANGSTDGRDGSSNYDGPFASLALSVEGNLTQALIACCRLACRMFVDAVSRGQALKDVVLPYSWLLPEDCSYVRVTDEGAANNVFTLIANKMLRPVYVSLERCFDNEEGEYLSFELFLRFFERARFNSIKLRTSLWPTVQKEARCYKERPAGFGTTDIVGGRNVGVSLDRQLEHIQSAQATSVAGYYEYLALFTAFPAAFSPQPTRSKRNLESPRHNLNLRLDIESSAMIRADAIEYIAEGEQMAVDRLTTTYFV
ncbi:TPR repeat [Trypanosoma brucei equiperdum]|uniref:TPR repeat n=1 Tax=Trypanosoma brucei equiperdum TaxID=630700 RepID=A0A3L6KT26_9TRYP|nr:TPR repeat [Trypanosoma brucei equiperdum]